MKHQSPPLPAAGPTVVPMLPDGSLHVAGARAVEVFVFADDILVFAVRQPAHAPLGDALFGVRGASGSYRFCPITIRSTQLRDDGRLCVSVTRGGAGTDLIDAGDVAPIFDVNTRCFSYRIPRTSLKDSETIGALTKSPIGEVRSCPRCDAAPVFRAGRRRSAAPDGGGNAPRSVSACADIVLRNDADLISSKCQGSLDEWKKVPFSTAGRCEACQVVRSGVASLRFCSRCDHRFDVNDSPRLALFRYRPNRWEWPPAGR